MTNTRRNLVLVVIALGALLLLAKAVQATSNVDSETGKPAHKTVTIHVSGSEIGYSAQEDTAFCVAPSVELSYTSNDDGSGTIVCSVP
jgi:maltose-binding protein MalE